MEKGDLYLNCELAYSLVPIKDSCVNYPGGGNFFENADGFHYRHPIIFPEDNSKLAYIRIEVKDGQIINNDFIQIDLCDRENYQINPYSNFNILEFRVPTGEFHWLNNSTIIYKTNYPKFVTFDFGKNATGTMPDIFDEVYEYDAKKNGNFLVISGKLKDSDTSSLYLVNHDFEVLDTIQFPYRHFFKKFRIIGDKLLGIYQIYNKDNWTLEDEYVAIFDFTKKSFSKFDAIPFQNSSIFLNPGLGFYALDDSRFTFANKEGWYLFDFKTNTISNLFEFPYCSEEWVEISHKIVYESFMENYLVVEIGFQYYLVDNPGIFDVRYTFTGIGFFNLENGATNIIQGLP